MLLAGFEVMRWRDFGPALLDLFIPGKCHPPVGPRTGRDIDSFQSNAATWLCAPRPPIVHFDEPGSSAPCHDPRPNPGNL